MGIVDVDAVRSLHAELRGLILRIDLNLDAIARSPRGSGTNVGTSTGGRRRGSGTNVPVKGSSTDAQNPLSPSCQATGGRTGRVSRFSSCSGAMELAPAPPILSRAPGPRSRMAGAAAGGAAQARASGDGSAFTVQPLTLVADPSIAYSNATSAASTPASAPTTAAQENCKLTLAGMTPGEKARKCVDDLHMNTNHTSLQQLIHALKSPWVPSLVSCE